MNNAENDTDAGNEARQKAKRRSKNDGDDRNYTCGCGKSYLSYPALYTHIKTKHDGVPPTGTSQNQVNGKSGRGRPKKEDSAAKHKDDDAEDESVDLSNSIENLIRFLNELSTRIEYDGQKTDEDKNSLTTKDSEVDMVKNFPLDIFKGREDEYSVIYDQLKQIKSGKAVAEDTVDPKTDLKQTPINKIIAWFIAEVAPNLRKEFYREFVYFMLMYRKALNKIGWECKAKLTGKGQTDESKEFSETLNGEYMPEICNDFITEVLPDYLREYDLRGFKVLGPDVFQIRNAVFLTMHFCNWLNFQKYSHSRLVLNADDNN
eukprot:CAMPEP_0176416370 /NCGR_PEP_ID=MMETSP0127-20121128/6311_1 /TAXON_ID=938130 /ORGANISM="Platyophrya macrostoma, Strain WH" /LENGTH=317 /DNA_ID=CAMNT_0017796443 /DNA_START=15 /DNA_END=968 /DNA_ORIENTATION=-